MKLKRWHLTTFLVAVLILVGLHWVSRTEFWLEWRTESMKARIAESFAEDETEYAVFAQLMREHSAQGDYYAYYENPSLSLPEEMISQAEAFIDERDVPFDKMYKTGDNEIIYPKDACVFRCTIWAGKDVYCWVDLIHTGQADFFEENPVTTSLNSEWYIVVLYGY